MARTSIGVAIIAVTMLAGREPGTEPMTGIGDKDPAALRAQSKELAQVALGHL